MSPSLRRLPHVVPGGFVVVLAMLCCPMPLFSAPLPDLAAVDKLFKEKRYAEALKGYAACEKCQIGERGYAILQSAICASALGDDAGAERCLKKAADEYLGSPTAERALYNLMSLYVMTGKWELAADARMRFLMESGARPRFR